MNKFNTADLCDDHSLIIAKPIFKSYGSLTHCFGKIKTVEAIEDNSYVKKLLQEDGSGYVMVVDGRGSEKCALVGDNLAALGAKNNWSGIIVNGCIRDSMEINNIGISIKAINLVPNKSEKKDIGKYGLDLNFAGVIFKENDFLYSGS
jgi:regulator of ribonuclease activity A